MHWSDVWEGKSLSARAARTLLSPLSWLYASVWQGYLLCYSLGLKRPREPHVPVICVGNLVAGGAGKSPITLYLARILAEMGHKVVIGCSGYGAPHSEGATVAPEGDLDAGEWGDEPSMFRWLLPGVPLIVGRARVAAAELCHERFPDAVLLMDDGFQHFPLRKHLTVVLDPPRRNRRCRPAGPYREPWGNRRRASLVLPNGFQPKFRITGIEGVTEASRGETLGSGPANVLCALGDPSRFLRDVHDLGFEPGTTLCLPDHDDLQRGNLMDPLDGSLPVLTTAKDWVKLRKRPDVQPQRVFVVRQEAAIEPEDAFRAWLQRELDELTKKSPTG